MSLTHDIVLDDKAFETAANDMKSLQTRAQTLRHQLETLYKSLESAMKTPSGEQLNLTAEEVLLEPVDKLILVVDHVAETLNKIIGTGYYKDVFLEFESLNQGL